ncbi:4-hydroxy-tetrahydrodipicolinate reductase [Aureimonas sp. AU4]|uniref:4-hydroxy-tetrahydrodipicolinate reductase n=1 Tax=Aureimonas sp. AU4 TaxID=1638163 RepID=UPI000781ED43|nr:4-hydroxy-tetrahydrodipicolinate reductase [Aureimonas sp. AU4]
MSEDLRLAILGAGGRMGRTLLRLAGETPGLRVAAALEREGSELAGTDAAALGGPPGVRVETDIAAALGRVDAVIDFTAPAASVAMARLAAERGLVHVIGTTGCTPEDDARIAEAAAGARIVKSGNMSLGVNLLAVLLEQAAKSLPAEFFDIEILEMHHRHKVDAPSGTALLLGQAAAQGRGVELDEASVRVRDGHTGARPQGAIGFATLRGGSVVGEHAAILAGEGERIELTHRAEDRAIFARGALRAVLWAASQPPGLYSMRDVLGLARPA